MELSLQDAEEKNRRDITKLASSVSFSPSCVPVSSDQSVFITIARDLLSFSFSLFVMNGKRDIISDSRCF